MRKIWLIALGGLTRTARDKKVLIIFLLMPMLIIGVLGAALQNMMGDVHWDPQRVLVINEDVPATPPVVTGAPGAPAALPPFAFGKILTDDVLGSPEVKRLFTVTTGAAADLESGRQAVAKGKYLGLIHIPASFTADVTAGKKATVALIADPGREESAAILAQVVGSFTEAVTSGVLAGKYLSPAEAAQMMTAANREALLSAGLPTVKEVSGGARRVPALAYYAAAMSIMFTLMTGLGRSVDILDERRQGTLDRMLVSPTSRGTIVAGQVLGTVLLVLGQFLIVLLGTRFLYGVQWGNWGSALLIGGSFALASAGIGVAVAGLLNDAKAADAAVPIVGNVFAALSGGMFPLYFFPPGLKLVAKFIPNYWALQAFLDQMAGTGASLVTPVALLITIGIATGAIGAWRLAVR